MDRAPLISQPVGAIVVPGVPVSDGGVPLVQASVARQVERHNRPCQDVACIVVFALVTVATIGLAAAAAPNTQFDLTCTVPTPPPSITADAADGHDFKGVGRSLSEIPPVGQMSELLKDHIPVLVGTAVVAVFLGILFIKLLQWFARAMTYMCAIMAPVIFSIIGVGMLQAGGYGYTPLYFFGAAGVWLLILICCRRLLEKVAELLRAASVCLQQNSTMVLSTLLIVFMTAIASTIYIGCIVLAVYSTTCDGATSEVPQMTQFGQIKLALSSFVYLWTMMTIIEIRVGHVAGAVGMWYFHKDDTSYDYPASPAFTALGWCFTSSFGSMCFGGMVLAIVEILRSLANKNSNNNNILMCILRCIIKCASARAARSYTVRGIGAIGKCARRRLVRGPASNARTHVPPLPLPPIRPAAFSTLSSSSQSSPPSPRSSRPSLSGKRPSRRWPSSARTAGLTASTPGTWKSLPAGW